MCSDEALLTAVADGDQTALRALYERHASATLRLIRRLTSDQGVAEEILQETWLAVWRSAKGFRAESSARGWLMGVARRQAHNQLRKSRPQLTDLIGRDLAGNPIAVRDHCYGCTAGQGSSCGGALDG